MKFYEIIKKLQEENKGYITLVKCGVFFVAIGKDAVILSERFGLNVICFKDGMCKCGIPESKIGKFMQKMAEKEMSFTIYVYNKDDIGEKVKKTFQYDKKIIEEDRICLDCTNCKNRKIKIDEIIENMKLENTNEE